MPGWFAVLLWGLNSPTPYNLRRWWRDRDLLSPVQRFSEFIEQVLLARLRQRIVIFIDEIDSVLSLPFPADEFFAAILACYNRRADNPDYGRLSFVLLGVATPHELIRDPYSTPFNIGRSLQLAGLQRPEADVLAPGLAAIADEPEALLDAILSWSGGSPFLTQKLCALAFSYPFPFSRGKEAELMARLVQACLLINWEANDEPEHLRTIRARLLREPGKKQRLQLYSRLLSEWELPTDDSPVQMELRLTEIAVWCPVGSRYPQPVLRIYNRIYTAIFNRQWLDRELAQVSEPLPPSGGQTHYRETVYQHLLACAEVDRLPSQLVERFRNLFLSPETYPKPEIANALRRLAQSHDSEAHFNQFVNRCCFIAINHWGKLEQRQATLAGLLEALRACNPLPPTATCLQICLHHFTRSPEYQQLEVRLQGDRQPRASRPLKNLILRYPYLYPYQVRDRDPARAERRRQRATRLKLTKQREFAQQLFNYTQHWLLPATDASIPIVTCTNPTLLADRQLREALQAFLGRVEGDRTYRELADHFLSQTRALPCYRDFKDELYEYLITTINVEQYGRHKFNNHLYEQLCNTLPESDYYQLNDVLLLETCSRLLNFLVVESARNPEHYTFIDLLTNVGPIPTTSLLLKIALLSRHVRPKLERRFSILFNHYGTEDIEKIRWFVDSLENLNVALGVHFNRDFDFSSMVAIPTPRAES